MRRRRDTPGRTGADTDADGASIGASPDGPDGLARSPQYEEFIAIAAHELRSPIAAIDLALHGMRRQAQRAGTISLEELERLVEPALRQTERLKNLVQNLLDASRLRATGMDLDLAQVDLAEILDEVVSSYGPLVEQAGCELFIEAPRWIRGVWDRGRLTQVISNLITNACKYAAKSAIRVTLEDHGAVVRLAVEDGGPGIAAADVERIFEPFVRVQPDSAAHSLGLGLYIVREIVHSHGGTVAVEPGLGGGARFLVTLPKHGRR